MNDALRSPFVGSNFSEDDFLAVRALLLEKRGFDLGMYKDACMKRRIAARVRALGFNRATPYLAVLQESETEVDTLIAALSIHVSQFFRNPEIFALLEREILPQLLRWPPAGLETGLRIWSIGCAGGEEPYSLALICHQLRPPGLKLSILGTDISQPILAQAQAASYDSLRLSEVPSTVRERYFTSFGRTLQLHESIRRMVEFREHNILSSEEYPAADLVLLRNVLIYFSRADQDRILNRLAECMPAGGVLVLGNAENMLGSARERFALEYPAERIYRRR